MLDEALWLLADVTGDALSTAVLVDSDLIWQIPHESFIQMPPRQIPGPLGQLAKAHRLVDQALHVVVRPAVVLYTTLKLVTLVNTVNASPQSCLFGHRQEFRPVQQAT